MADQQEDRINVLCYEKQVTGDEVDIEKQVRQAVAVVDQDANIVPVWGLTLYHIKDLPFKPRETMDA